MKLKSIAVVASLLLPVAPGMAASPEAKASDLIDVQSATCAQFAKAISYARPPAKATKKQETMATMAQDDLVLAMTWVNGYLAGRDGAKGAHAFNKEWIVSYMAKLSDICKAHNGTMLLSDAAAKL